MAINQQLNFLQEKIKEIGSAIFFNLSESILKLPTSIVSSIRVDDYGYVWFFIQKPKQNLKEFDPEFPVRLDFFRKGTSYFLQVCGKGWVVNDPEETNTFYRLFDNQPNSIEGMVLVKVKIMKAEYYETKSSNQTTWVQSAVNKVITWFRNSNHYRPDTTYFPAS